MVKIRKISEITDQEIMDAFTELEREETGTPRYWELFTEERKERSETAKNEIEESKEILDNLNSDDEYFEEDYEHYLWVIDWVSAELIINNWELEYMYDSERNMDNWDDSWLNNLVCLWVEKAGYDEVQSLLNKGKEEYPHNPVRALARVPLFLEKEGYISTDLLVLSINRLIPYMKEKI